MFLNFCKVVIFDIILSSDISSLVGWFSGIACPTTFVFVEHEGPVFTCPKNTLQGYSVIIAKFHGIYQVTAFVKDYIQMEKQRQPQIVAQ